MKPLLATNKAAALHRQNNKINNNNKQNKNSRNSLVDKQPEHTTTCSILLIRNDLNTLYTSQPVQHRLDINTACNTQIFHILGQTNV